MSRLRQLPELFLRGSLAQETMKHLTPEQQRRAEELTKEIVNSPRLAPNRNEFKKMLGRTIAGDYKEDRNAADQEFHIAVWRGVIHLMHHRSYQFHCNHCNQGAYLTQRGKPTAFSRRHPVCPNCHFVMIDDPGDSPLAKGQMLHNSEFERCLIENAKVVPNGQGGVKKLRPPTCTSPIVPIPGELKVADPEAVLNDPDQLHKFFSEFIWNYFRQIINENEIKKHQKEPQAEVGFADRMAVLEICNLLAKHKVKHSYCDNTEPSGGAYHIVLDTYAAPPEFVAEFSALVKKYLDVGVGITSDDRGIAVDDPGAVVMIEAFVSRPTPVMVATSRGSIGESDELDCPIDKVDFKFVRGVRADQEDPVAQLERLELVAVVRNALPDGTCQTAYDLLMGVGDLADANRGMADSRGRFRPRQVAEILKVPMSEMDEYTRNIKINMLVHNFVPEEDWEDQD